MPHDYDLFVIGGGSGGVRCARIAAGHGARVGIAEEWHWGGTCVNVGCVPKKLMVQAAEYGALAEDSRGFGWDGRRAGFDWPALIAAKDAEIARLNGIYVRLLEGAGVRWHEARATFLDAHTLQVGRQRVTAERIVIAVGGRPADPGIEGAGLGITSDAAFHLPVLPQRVVMVGAGYIGVEFAGIFRGLGAEVDLVYRQKLPLRGFDEDLREDVAAALAAQGIRLHPGATAQAVVPEGEARRVRLSDGQTLETDLVFFAQGRRPHTRGLGLEQAGVAVAENGGVLVDELQQTSAPGIYAIGDVSNRLNLTPVAIAEGHALADRLFGPAQPRSWSFAAVPTAVFTSPPLATAGLTEAQAAEHGPVDVYLARFTPMRHTLTGRAGRRSTMKLLVDQASQRVVGAHMLGEDAPEMMQGIAVAMTAGATKADFDRTIGIHPTGAEEWVTLRTRTRVAGLAPAEHRHARGA